MGLGAVGKSRPFMSDAIKAHSLWAAGSAPVKCGENRTGQSGKVRLWAAQHGGWAGGCRRSFDYPGAGRRKAAQGA